VPLLVFSFPQDLCCDVSCCVDFDSEDTCMDSQYYIHRLQYMVVTHR